MSAPYTRRIDNPTGKVYINPNTGIFTHGVPPLGLSPAGLWVPFSLDEKGALVVNTNTEVLSSDHYDDAQADTTPGIVQNLVTQTVPSSTIRLIKQVIVSTRVTGIFWITANGATIGSGRTGPAGFPMMTFDPPRPIQPGVEYKVNFQSRSNSEIQSVECYVQGFDVPQ